VAAVLIASFILLVVAGFVVYGVARLVQVNRGEDDESRRLAALVRTEREAEPVAATPAAGASPPHAGLRPGPPGAAAAADVSRAESVLSSGPPLGLRAISEEAVFFRRAKDGQVTVQVGAKPSMPLTYVLDPKTRAVLQAVVKRVDETYAGQWAVLAEEDPEGRLRLTRLG
jgi:hypothetical protein